MNLTQLLRLRTTLHTLPLFYLHTWILRAYAHVKIMFVNEIEVMYERPLVNVKVERGSTFTYTRDVPYIVSVFFFTRAKCTCLHTWKMEYGETKVGIAFLGTTLSRWPHKKYNGTLVATFLFPHLHFPLNKSGNCLCFAKDGGVEKKALH